MVTTIYAVRALSADNGSSDLLLFADRRSAERHAESFRNARLLGVDSVDVVERSVFGLLGRAVLTDHGRMWDTVRALRLRAKKGRKARAHRAA